MKKILLWIVMSLNIWMAYSLLQPIQAATDNESIQKTFVCKVGTPYYNQLSYPGYKIISSNVNFDCCGHYQIIYEDEKTKERIEKQIEVRSEDDLMNGMVLQEHIELYVKNHQNYIYHQTKKAEDGNYIVSYLQPIEGKEEVYDIGVMKLNLEEILFQTTIFTQVKGRIVDFIVDQEKIILLIEKDNIATRQDLYVVVLNEVGQIIFENCYFGSGIEFGKKLLMDQDNYYIVGETTSKDEYFLTQQLHKCGFVFCIRKNNYQLVARHYLSNCADTEVIDATIQNQNIAILTRYFDPSKQMKVMDIWYLNGVNQSQVEKKYFTTTLTETFLKLKVDENNQLYIATSDYLYSIQKYVTNLYHIKDNYEKELIYQIYGDHFENITFLDFIPLNEQEQIILFSLYQPNQEKPYGYLYQRIEDSEVQVQIEQYCSNESIQGFVGDSTIDLVLASPNSLSVHHIVFLYMQYKSNQQISSFASLDYPILYTNQEVHTIDEKLSQLPLNKHIFGDYDICYVFLTQNLEIAFLDRIRILPQINLANQETYDINTELIFNGRGYLNNRIIPSGYTIENEGDYTFVLEGNQQEQIELHFRIASLSDSKVIKEKKQPTIQNQAVLSNLEIENQVTLNNAINHNDFQRKAHSQVWFLFLPLSILIASYIYIKKRG
ncbi:MAG: hypothetical protein NC090_02650 [Anaeroplasma bactoclasticum]|nr:hypothetical protein [Anaeroplasma bactoclasticum]